MPNHLMTHTTAGRLLSTMLALTAIPVALSAQAAPAAATGAGWTAWTGCWAATLEGRDGVPVDSAAATRRVCVLPAGGHVAEVRTVERGRVVRTDTIDASGARRARTREGCRGWEQASWSQDRRRVFTQSEYACEGGVTRAVRGVLALTPSGEWVDVRSLTAGGPAAVQIARFHPAAIPRGVLPALDALVVSRGMAIDAAQTAAMAPLTPAVVAEASQRAGANTTSAWIAAVGQPFTLSARDLLALKQAGVPGQVTDMMIAVSNPRVFAVAAADGRGTPRPAERVARGLADGGRVGQVVVLRPGVYDPFWGMGYGTYGYGYGPGYLGSAYGLGYGPGYGFGYGGYYPGGWFAGGVPVAIVRPATPTPRTRLTNGSGYSQEGGTPGAAAYPRNGWSASDGRTSMSPGGYSNGSSSRGSSSGSASSGGSSEGGRTAKPRP